MKYFLFPKFNCNHFLFISYFFISSIRELINRKMRYTKDIISTFNYYYLSSLSDFISIFPIIIIKFRSRRSKIYNDEDINTRKNSDKEQLIYNNMENETKCATFKKIYKIYILLSFFDFLAQYSKVTYSVIIQKTHIPVKSFNLNSVLIFEIIAQYLCNRIILHYLFYKHHYLSFSINIIFIIILGVIDMIQISKTGNKAIMSFFYILSRILSSIFYALEDTLAKIIITYNSFSPYSFLFFRGIFVNFFVTIFTIVFIYVDLPDEKGVESCVLTRFWKVYESKTNTILYVALIILLFLYNINLFFIVDKFSSSHLALASILGNFGSLLNSIIFFKNIEISELIWRLFLYFILIIAASIHNEFIVLKFCGFEKHTKLYLEQKAQFDIEQTELNFEVRSTSINSDNEELITEKMNIELI